MILPLLLFVIAFVPMAIEARRSHRNERWLRTRRAFEPPEDVYPAMSLTYPTCFAAMVIEAWLRQRTFNDVFTAGVGVFVVAKALKYWAIASLGPLWTFRVLVPPDLTLVASGPYRFMSHPNYAAVVGELGGMALMAQAPVAGTISIAAFGVLLLARIRIEERALDRCSGGSRGARRDARGV